MIRECDAGRFCKQMQWMRCGGTDWEVQGMFGVQTRTLLLSCVPKGSLVNTQAIVSHGGGAAEAENGT